MPINLSIVDLIIKSTHIFDNICIASKSCIIKVFPKSDISIVWIDIWNSQSSTSTKTLINQCFNVESHITTIYKANINPSIFQCKNCWKWKHTTFICWAQGSYCVKCNDPHKIKHHHHFALCCKANFKTNPSHFKTKQDESCSYTFKCLNCKREH